VAEDVFMRATFINTAAILLVMASAQARAQPPSSRANVTFGGGYAGFLDDAVIDHGVAGAGAEWVLTPRLGVGPEVLYMIGPGSDRDLFVLGVARFGIRPFSTALAPYVVAGGGLMRHSSQFGGHSFASTEGAFIVGAGVRVRLADRVFVAPEVTAGWEPHVRVSVSVGIALP
jgi:opacity protein-like surface antigen